eukprot:c21830_g1_i1 orf=1-519(-)
MDKRHLRSRRGAPSGDLMKCNDLVTLAFKERFDKVEKGASLPLVLEWLEHLQGTLVEQGNHSHHLEERIEEVLEINTQQAAKILELETALQQSKDFNEKQLQEKVELQELTRKLQEELNGIRKQAAVQAITHEEVAKVKEDLHSLQKDSKTWADKVKESMGRQDEGVASSSNP